MSRPSSKRGNPDLADFLATHRAKFQPEDMGLPAPTGRGRRADGLSYDDLATLMTKVGKAYLSGNYVARLCRGEVPATEQLLNLIAQVLQMLPRERVDLFQRATGRDPGPLEIEAAGADLSAGWKRRLARIPAQITKEGDHEVVGPLVYSTNLVWDLLTYNDAFAQMFIGGVPPANVFKWIALDGEPQLPEHETLWLGLVLPQLRGLLYKYRDHPGLMELERWCEETPGVAEAWSESANQSYQTPDGDIRPLVHAKYGPGSMEMGVLTPHRDEDRDLRVLFMDFHIAVTPGEVQAQRARAGRQ